MADQKPLSYKKSTLIESLQEQLDKNAQERADAKKKADEKAADVVDAITKAMAKPQFVMALVSALQYQYGTGVSGVPDPTLDADQFSNWVEKTWPDRPGYADDSEPDAELTRLIRVYTKAEDDVVEVHPTDNVYRYL